jgi:hypothetical protein
MLFNTGYYIPNFTAKGQWVCCTHYTAIQYTSTHIKHVSLLFAPYIRNSDNVQAFMHGLGKIMEEEDHLGELEVNSNRLRVRGWQDRS